MANNTGMWASLFQNGADILNANGNMIAKPIEATGNMISNIIDSAKGQGSDNKSLYKSQAEQAKYKSLTIAGVAGAVVLIIFAIVIIKM